MDDPLSLGALGLSFIAGSLSTLSPCVFPLLPLVVGGAVLSNRMAPMAMGAGMAVSFSLFGLFLGTLGPALGIDADKVRTFGASLLIIFSAMMLSSSLSARFSERMTTVANYAYSLSTRLNIHSIPGALSLGALLGLLWSPCSGPLLGSALTLVVSDGGAISGALILAVFGIGAAIPLLIVAYVSRDGIARVRAWLLDNVERIKKVFAGFLALMGLAILTGIDKWLEAQMLSMMAAEWIRLIVRY